MRAPRDHGGGQMPIAHHEINRKNRIAWGASLSHIPYRTGSSYYAGVDTLIANNGDKYLADKFVTDLLRIFEDRAGIFAQFPLSQTRRFEIGSSFSHYGYRLTEYNNYYQSGRFVLQDKQKLDAPPGFNLGNVNAAFVGDNSSFGIASPLQGYRYRLGVEQYFGEWAFTGLTADFRKYQYLKPISLAVRGLHYGRYGKDATNLPPLYIGNPTLVRGYRFGAVGDLDINQMIGSKIFVSNFEVRLPFTGPERLSLIKSKFLLTELALFVDGGVAWDDFSQFGGGADPRLIQPKAVFSTGASMRVNLFGALILEPYYAFPLQKGSKGVFGLNIVPGW